MNDSRPDSSEGEADPSAIGPTNHADAETVLVVRLGEAEFGLPVRCVREVLRTALVSRVPFPPPHVTGVLALRGQVIPVVDLGARVLGRPSVRPGILVVAHEPESLDPIGLLVDAVLRLVDAAAATRVEAPAEAEATLPPGWVESVVTDELGRPITVLDLSMVLPNPAAHGPT